MCRRHCHVSVLRSILTMTAPRSEAVTWSPNSFWDCDCFKQGGKGETKERAQLYISLGEKNCLGQETLTKSKRLGGLDRIISDPCTVITCSERQMSLEMFPWIGASCESSCTNYFLWDQPRNKISKGISPLAHSFFAEWAQSLIGYREIRRCCSKPWLFCLRWRCLIIAKCWEAIDALPSRSTVDERLNWQVTVKGFHLSAHKILPACCLQSPEAKCQNVIDSNIGMVRNFHANHASLQ